MSNQQQTIKAVNQNGNFIFDTTGKVLTNCNSFTVNARESNGMGTARINMEADNESYLRTNIGSLTLESQTDKLNLSSTMENAEDAIHITANADGGGIKIESDTNGILLNSRGNVNINSTDANINIGYGENADRTNNIFMDATDLITATASDVAFIASDSISLISLTGDISLGSSINQNIIKFENNNLLINQTTSAKDYQLDIKITDGAANTYNNGISVDSTNIYVSSEIVLSHANGSASMFGMTSANTTATYYKYLDITQQGINIIPLLNSFSPDDVGRTIYYSDNEIYDKITRLSTYISAASNTYATTDLITSGFYEGAEDVIIRVEIDSIDTPNTFRWNSNGGNPRGTFIPLETDEIFLFKGIYITFTATVGHSLGDYWTFSAKVSAIAETSSDITNDRIFIIKPYTTYIENTNNISDIDIRPAQINRINIRTNGGIQINSSLAITNKYNNPYLINTYNNNYQLNPVIASLESGGYVIVWESNGDGSDGGQDGDGYAIWGQLFMNDGEKYGPNFRVNLRLGGNQRFPFVAAATTGANYIITWISEEEGNAGSFDIYAQVYIDNNLVVETDIIVDSGVGQQLYPKATGLANGNYLIVWASDDAANNNYNVYGRIISAAGILQGPRFRINTSTTYSHLYPYPFAFSADDNGLPSGFGVVFLNEYVSTDTAANEIADNDRYNIQYKLYNSGGVAQTGDVDITDSTEDRITLTDGNISAIGLAGGNFAVSFFRNYGGITSIYSIGDNIESQTTDFTATIDAIDADTITVSGMTSSDRLQVGEEIIISNYWVEKIAKVSHNGGGSATITLERGHKSLYVFKYTSTSSTPIYTEIVNTSALVEDGQRNTYGNFDVNSIFASRRQSPSMCEVSDGNLFITWTNGKTPSVYGQYIDVITGTKTGNELLLSKNKNINQRNPVCAHKGDYILIAWDTEAADLHQTGIYAMCILIQQKAIFNVGGNKLHVDSAGVGIGTKTPLGLLHIAGEDSQYSSIVIENKNADECIDISKPINSIRYMNNETEISNITVNYSKQYQQIAMNFDDLMAYYTFDEEAGTSGLNDKSGNRLTGRIENFDIYSCWKTGIIGKALEFNGSNTYAYIPATQLLNGLALSEFGFTVCAWIKIPINAVEGDILNQGSSNFATGNYFLKITSDGHIKYGLTTDAGPVELTSGGNTLNDNEWHYIVGTYSVGDTTQKIYIDGVENSNASVSGVVNDADNSNVFIGASNEVGGFFRGYIDEMRFYNKPLNATNIAKLYKYGSDKNKVAIQINEHITVDDNKILNMQIKGDDYKLISGTVQFVENDYIVSGIGTSFTKEIAEGDVITFDGNSLTVKEVINDTTLNMLSPPNQNINNTRTIGKPAILTAKDAVGNSVLNIDYDGKFRIGTGDFEQYGQFELCAESPMARLINTDGGSTLWQNGNTTATYQTMEGSSTGLAITSGMRNIIMFRNSGEVGINDVEPLGKFQITANYQEQTEIILKSDDYPERVGGEKSMLYFIGSNSIGENSGGLAMNALASITGASDSNTIDVDGRLDFYTNNALDEIGLQRRMTITKTGAVCVGAPSTITKGVFHIAPRFALDEDATATQTGNDVILSDNIITDDILNGLIIYGNDGQTTRRIIEKPTNLTLTTDRPATIDDATPITIHYAGLYVDNRGNVGVGTTAPLNRFQINGPLATAIKTVYGNYTITLRDSTVLANATDGPITLTLDNMEGNAGRIHTMKKLDNSPNSITIQSNNSLIDGLNTQTLQFQYETICVQCDGVNWWILNRFNPD